MTVLAAAVSASLALGLAGCGARAVPAPAETTASPATTLLAADTGVATAPAPAPAASSTGASSAAPTSAPPPATASPVPSPALDVTCPSATTSAHATFGHAVTGATTYSVAIDYGDGRSYTGDDAHLAAVFSHTYSAAGTYLVTATLTPPAGPTATSNCTFVWSPPAAVVASGSHDSTTGGGGRSSVSGGSSASSDSGSSSGDSYTDVDGVQVHDPVEAPAAPAGATAQCRDGSWSFSQHHSGTCSHHGGVADWL